MDGRVIISRLKFDIERRGKGWKALCGLTIITRLGPSTSTRNEEAITFLANLLVRRSDCSWGGGQVSPALWTNCEVLGGFFPDSVIFGKGGFADTEGYHYDML